MLSKYLIGLVGLGTVAGGVTATTIVLNKKNQEQIDKKENKEKLTKEEQDVKDVKAPKGPGTTSSAKSMQTPTLKSVMEIHKSYLNNSFVF